MNYTWKLLSLKKRNTEDLNDVIIQTTWQKIGTDENGNTGSFPGTSEFQLDTVDPDNFISYENLTEEIVVGWIQSSIPEGYEAHADNVISNQIDEKASRIIQVNSGFPWDPEPVGIATTS
jgi:hypothetical protein